MKVRFLCADLIVLVLLVGTPHRAPAQAVKAPPERTGSIRVEVPYRGGLVNPPLPKPKFTLTDTSGVPFDLSVKTQGLVTLLFFGYTHCPDMCPNQMAMIGSALRKMPAEVADQLKVVFVTTDPARDDSKVPYVAG
jgi:protein SCO1/2